MSKCKFCNAELNENSSVCPVCGQDNAEAGEKKQSGTKTLLVLAVIVCAVMLLAYFVMNGRQPAVQEVPVETEAAAEVTETADAAEAEEPVEIVEATVPADGNPDDVTCKGTYTADDDAVIAARDTVVATAGDRELTLSQLQVFYWMEVRNFMSQYGAYAAYFGLDIQQPLDTQPCEVTDTPMTWQQYFLDSALNAWTSYSAMSAAADADGYEMPAAMQQALENVADNLNNSAIQNGFESGIDMIHTSLGKAVELEDYRFFMENYYKANGYFNELRLAIQPTAEDLEAYFEEHAEGYADAGITKETKSVDVRHILIFPEGADSSSVMTDEISEEAWAAGEETAQAILNEWLEGDATEESFAALANERSQDPGSNTNGGLYQEVTEGQMVQAFNDWCFDPARQVGDTGIVRTEYGFHVMFFSGSHLLWQEYAENDFITETMNKKADDIAAASPATVKYENILLGSVELF